MDIFPTSLFLFLLFPSAIVLTSYLHHSPFKSHPYLSPLPLLPSSIAHYRSLPLYLGCYPPSTPVSHLHQYFPFRYLSTFPRRAYLLIPIFPFSNNPFSPPSFFSLHFSIHIFVSSIYCQYSAHFFITIYLSISICIICVVTSPLSPTLFIYLSLSVSILYLYFLHLPLPHLFSSPLLFSKFFFHYIFFIIPFVHVSMFPSLPSSLLHLHHLYIYFFLSFSSFHYFFFIFVLFPSFLPSASPLPLRIIYYLPVSFSTPHSIFFFALYSLFH